MKERTVLVILVLVLGACLVQVAWAAEENAVQGNGHSQLKKADVNPDFTAFLNEKTAGRWVTVTVEGRKLGFIPPMVSLQHLQGMTLPEGTFVTREGVAKAALAALPTKFDLRTTGKVTSVKDQGNCGDCWAYATYGSLESFFMPPPWDFSEAALNKYSGFSVGSCLGGNQFMSTAYLSRWSGPVLETAPDSTDVVDHVQDVVFIPMRSSSLDNTNLKNAISTTGAVYSAFYFTSSSYNPAKYAYYYSGRSTSNHAIALVGWDDTFSRTNFRPSAPGNGAFIAKNSWGSSWGDKGYFYISYYDKNIGSDNAAFTGEPLGNYQTEYQYDPLGWVTSWGCSRSDTAWFANIFNSTSAGKLAAVSFYSATTNSPYEIRVYTNPTNGPVSGTLAYDGTGTVASPGYHTVKITSPVPLTANEKFSVVVKLRTPGYNYPIPAEQAFSGYSDGAKSKSGESYVSCDGNSWTDLTTLATSANVCLKAFTT